MSSDKDAAGFWEGRYAERDQVWSGEPNQVLVTVVTGFPPGRAFDLGCGEGGDSVWLARQGWQVTSVDLSPTAITRAKSLAASSAVPAGSITWVVEDLRSWQPPGPCELVAACFLHSPVDFPRAGVLRRAASSVTPGGHLLVVGHAARPPWAEAHEHAEHRFLGPGEELDELQLDEATWETVVSDVRSREATGPNGERARLDDAVVLVRRR